MFFEKNWHRLYIVAALEIDRSKMEQRIETARTAVKARLHEFALDSGGTPEELVAIAEVQRRLEMLGADVARWRAQDSL